MARCCRCWSGTWYRPRMFWRKWSKRWSFRSHIIKWWRRFCIRLEEILFYAFAKLSELLFFQVFRSSIDAAYLPLLQDWLVCSLSNFLNLPQAKSIWCLSVIFVSATLNVHLLKIISHILSLKAESDGGQVDPCLVHYFAVATQDFADKLTKTQKQVIVDCLTNSAHEIIQAVGRSL